MDAVYFSKVEFHQCFYMYQRGMQIWGDEKIIFLDIPNQELSVQIIRTGQVDFESFRDREMSMDDPG